MPYITIENFKYGLDTRRSELTSQPGTLEVLNNCHVNQGGEVEKRKAFVLQGNTNAFANTFGLQDTDSGIAVFGDTVTTSPTLPTGFYFVALHHAFLPTSRLTAILSSTVFNGKYFVIGQWDDGKVFAYYNSVNALFDMRSGIFPFAATAGGDPDGTAPANAFVTAINASTQYTVTQHAFPNNNIIDVFSLPGNLYALTDVLSLQGGSTETLAIQKVNNGISPVTAVAAIGQFTVVNGSAAAGNKITSVTINAIEVLGANVLWTTNNENTASLIASQINTYASVPEYTATAQGSTVVITSSTAGATPNNYVVITTCTGNMCVGSGSFTLVGTAFTLNDLTADGVTIITATTKAKAMPTNFASLSAFATGIAGDINSQTSAGLNTGFLAFAKGASVYISRAVTSSSDAPVNIAVSITPTGTGSGGTSDGTGSALLVSASPVNVGTATTGGNNYTPKYATSVPVSGTATGGTPPYIHNWKEYSAGSGNGIVPLNQNAYTTQFKFVFNAFNITNPTGVTGIFVDQVTDAAGNVAVSNIISVNLKAV